MMIKTHRLTEADAAEPAKIAQIAQQLIDGLPEDFWHEWDDWAKGLK